MREITYVQAIREAHAQLLANDPRVFVIGQGLWSPWYAGASLKDIDREFGRDRILDSPVSENAVTGTAIGAAIAGMRPIVFHPRMDFMLLAVDPIVNQAANWSYMFSGQVSVPVVIRASINRGGQQGAQHSQAVHAMFMHVPGIKVVMPSTPCDAKGLLMAAVSDGNPVLYVDDRWLYDEVGDVPEYPFETPIGKAEIRRTGGDVTIIGVSFMAREAERAGAQLAEEGISADVIDLRSLKPWDKEAVLRSVRKTGRAVVADSGWYTCGAAAEIAATISADAFRYLRAPVQRVALPDAPAPTSPAQEKAYFRTAAHIIEAVKTVLAVPAIGGKSHESAAALEILPPSAELWSRASGR
jgi:pyruvate dehydrogenase E1 component beta subunit